MVEEGKAKFKSVSHYLVDDESRTSSLMKISCFICQTRNLRRKFFVHSVPKRRTTFHTRPTRSQNQYIRVPQVMEQPVNFICWKLEYAIVIRMFLSLHKTVRKVFLLCCSQIPIGCCWWVFSLTHSNMGKGLSLSRTHTHLYLTPARSIRSEKGEEKGNPLPHIHILVIKKNPIHSVSVHRLMHAFVEFVRILFPAWRDTRNVYWEHKGNE